MGAILPRRAREELARSVYRDIVTGRDTWYVFAANTTADSPVLEDTWASMSQVHRNILYINRVRPADVVFMARRIDWVAGTVYTRYDDADVGLMDKNFYVMTNVEDVYRVYKCLDNNRGAPSTVRPEFVDPILPFTTADGYLWKFMCQITSTDVERFMTPTMIPVRYYTSADDFSVNGFVNSAIATKSGSGYTWAEIEVIGDGTGAVVRPLITSGGISGVQIVSSGSGYSTARAVVHGDGTGAVVRLGLSSPEQPSDDPDAVNRQVASEGVLPGAIHVISVEEPGQKYLAGQTKVSIVGDGSGAVAAVSRVYGGEIARIDIVSEGTGYTKADVTLTGVGFGAQARAIISPQGGHGSNIPKELGATVIGIFTHADNDSTTDFFVGNDYRQIGMIKNPKKFDTDILNDMYSDQTHFIGDAGTSCYVATLAAEDVTRFEPDDVVTTDAGGRFIVLQKRGNQIWLHADLPHINATSLLTNTTRGNLTAVGINSLALPSFQKLSGDIMYVRDIFPFIRTPEQSESYQLFLKF